MQRVPASLHKLQGNSYKLLMASWTKSGVMYGLILGCVMLLHPAAAFTYKFQDPSLSWSARVDDLVSKLTVDEITQQMARGGRTTYAPSIPRLGIKPYSWGTECLRGDVQAGPATSFPQALGLAASFSREVIFNMSRATSLEVRAKFNNYTKHGEYGEHKGVSCWSPVINIMRDPRWGRNQETYGEDPYMSGELAAVFVTGLQGNDARYVIANAGCKHFDAYGGPENIPVSRDDFDAVVSERDWRMTFLPQFRRCVEAGTLSLMCSYNRINGVPACANKKLLTDILRGEWGFRGYVISDEGALQNILWKHKYTSTKEATAAAAVNAGTNLEDGPVWTSPILDKISDAVRQGLIKENFLREAVKPLFYVRMRLGEFDPTEMVPFSNLQPEDFIQCDTHREMSLLAAMRSFVLLKNIDGFLPLQQGKQFGLVALVGPFADNLFMQFGAYSPEIDPRYSTTPRQGLQRLSNSTKYTAGCLDWPDTACATYNSSSVQTAVSGIELVVVCLGTGENIEGESNDRGDINLPGKQLDLLQDAVKYSGTAPVILVLFNAGPLDVTWAQNSPRVRVILEVFFPAQATGEALGRVFYNDGPGANPAGRLPSTWPMSLAQLPPITDYTMKQRTYRYSRQPPLYPFGYGLSYTNFSYEMLTVRPTRVSYPNNVYLDVYVRNVGQFDGEEVVQAYVSWTNQAMVLPIRQLVGFDRVFIPRNQGRMVTFKVHVRQLAVWLESPGGFGVLAGTYQVYVGGQQPHQAVTVGSNVLQGTFQVDTFFYVGNALGLVGLHKIALVAAILAIISIYLD